jgi:hypothetical protein
VPTTETAQAAAETIPSETSPVAAWADAAHASGLRARRRRLLEARADWKAALRRRGVVTVAAAMTFAGGGAAAAHETAKPAKLVRAGASGASVAQIQKALGISADGVFGPQTRQAVRRFQTAKGLLVDGIVGPVTLRALGLATAAPAPAAAVESDVAAKSRALTGTAVLDAIARCESGGNPTAVSADGRYRGKYQFARATWRALGGSGDPAAAPEAEQDRLAAALYARDGGRPWPVCGRR